MRGRQTHFYALKEDFIENIKELEEKLGGLQYIKDDFYYDISKFEKYDTIENLTNIGTVREGTYDGNFHSQWRYFVLRKGEEFEYKEVQLLDGRYRYDLKNTKGTIIFEPSGLYYDTNCVIKGHIATVSEDERSQFLFKEFKKALLKKMPENMLNGILDKAKSKITGKPVAQVQLERIGVDVKVRNSGIKIDGTTRAGDEIDKIKNNLGHNFPIYDNLEVENGVTIATSTKARDITSKTYSSTEYKNGFYNRIKGDIDDILSFEKGVSGKTIITKAMIDKKVLEISINEHELTKQQIDNIKRGVDYGKMNKVEVKFIIEK